MDQDPSRDPSPESRKRVVSINFRKQGHKHSFGSPTKNGSGGGGNSGSSMAVFVYMLLTKDKSKTHPIVTTVLPAANRLRAPELLPASPPSSPPSSPSSSSSSFLCRRALPHVEIRNKDSQFLDQVALLIHTHDALRGKSKGSNSKGNSKGMGKSKTRNKSVVITPSTEEQGQGQGQGQGQTEEGGHVEAVDVAHCQLLSQEWRKKPGHQEARTLVVTPQGLLLCEEALDKQVREGVRKAG